MCWFLVDLICSNLREFTCLETICRECPTEATSSIESNSIFSHTESLCCPMTIDDKLISYVILIPWFSFIYPYHGGYLWWSWESILWMKSSMYNNKFITLNNMRQRLEPFTIFIESTCRESICWNFFFYPVFPTLRYSLEWVYMHHVKECKKFMIPLHTICIGTMHHILDDFMWLRSLVDEISDKIEIIIVSYTCMSNKCNELIMTSVHITDKKSSLLHILKYIPSLIISNSIFSKIRNYIPDRITMLRLLLFLYDSWELFRFPLEESFRCKVWYIFSSHTLEIYEKVHVRYLPLYQMQIYYSGYMSL